MSLGGSASKSKSSTTESSTSSSTTNATKSGASTGTQTRNPWGEVVPFITGQNGVLQKASDLYGKSGTASPDLTSAFADLTGAGRANAAAAQGLASQIKPVSEVSARTATNAGQVGGVGQMSAPVTVKGQYAVGGAPVAANDVGVLSSFAKLGGINPTSAFGDLLKGDVNPYTQQQLDANTAATKASFDQMVSDAGDDLTRRALPAIRSGAILAGQMGGTRQGVAEGVAKGDADRQLKLSAQGLSTALGATNANTLAAASEAAQGRKAGAAQFLGGLGVGTDQSNADRALDASKFNSAQASDLSKFNAGLDADLNRFNASTVNDATKFNASNAADIAKFNASNAFDLDRFNATQASDADRTNTAVAQGNNSQLLDTAKTASGLTGDAFSQILQGLTGASSFDATQLGAFADLLAQYAGLGGTTNTNEAFNEALNEASNENSTGTSKTKGSSFGLTAKYGGK